MFTGAETDIEVDPAFGEIESALNVLNAITVLAVNDPTRVALPVVVSPKAEAVMASDLKISTRSFVLSNHA
jgi:hypothetical protein